MAPKLWFRTGYPHGIGPYNHGVSDLRFGPDGKLYLASGSRTDGGEAGTDPQLGQMGETDITAAVWRFEPKATEPQLEVVARGIRNAYSLNWDGAGNLFTVANGPDAHAGEEMDHVVPPKAGEPPRHHGFPLSTRAHSRRPPLVSAYARGACRNPVRLARGKRGACRTRRWQANGDLHPAQFPRRAGVARHELA